MYTLCFLEPCYNVQRVLVSGFHSFSGTTHSHPQYLFTGVNALNQSQVVKALKNH